MPFRPPNKMSRERIMAVGGAGSGKSYNFYSIAKRALSTGSDAMFYVIDTDVSVGRMLSNEDFAALTDDEGTPHNIVSVDVGSFQEFMSAITEFQAAMRDQDWLLIDMLSPTWDWCQDHFTKQVFKSGLSDYFLGKRAAMKNSSKETMFEGWVDWPVINGMYGTLQNKLLRSPGNLFVCNEAKALNRDQAEKDTAVLFGPYGIVPTGQKRNPHLFQTILWHKEMKPGERCIVSIKDRSREPMLGTPINDFSIDYLVKVAGWKLGGGIEAKAA